MMSFAFGFKLDPQHPLAQLDENGMGAKVNWLDELAARMGHVKPVDDEDVDYDDPVTAAAFERYYAAQRELQESLGCCIHEYGHEYSPDFFVEVRVPQDEKYSLCKQLDLEALKAADNPENRERLRHFCKLMDIEYCEPSWCVLRHIHLD